MQQYLDLLNQVKTVGTLKQDRTGTGTISLFGTQTRYNLTQGFPLLTTKLIHFKSVVHELIWFLSGNTNTKYLTDNGVRIWNEWADSNGELGPVYGKQWRDFNGVDQITNLIHDIKTNPNSRRLIVSAWNPSDIPKMKLPPCHTFFQFYVEGDKLSCQLYQRSADLFLGAPFNIASYALLTHMIAQVTNLKVKDFIHTIGDAHIYTNHLEQVELQLTRTPLSSSNLVLNSNITDIFDFKYEDISIENYKHYSAIRAKVSV